MRASCLFTYQVDILVALVMIFGSPSTKAATAPQVAQVSTAGGSVWGIVTDKKDDWIMVKIDNEAEPIRYVIPDRADPKLIAAAKTIFTVARVHVSYTNEGDVRKLTSIKRDMSKPKGTVTGEILSVHDFWVEVQPKDGPPDGYSPGGVAWKEMAEKLKTLKKGDVVTIKFYSDGERKRIDNLDVLK